MHMGCIGDDSSFKKHFPPNISQTTFYSDSTRYKENKHVKMTIQTYNMDVSLEL